MYAVGHTVWLVRIFHFTMVKMTTRKMHHLPSQHWPRDSERRRGDEQRYTVLVCFTMKKRICKIYTLHMVFKMFGDSRDGRSVLYSTMYTLSMRSRKERKKRVFVCVFHASSRCYFFVLHCTVDSK